MKDLKFMKKELDKKISLSSPRKLFTARWVKVQVKRVYLLAITVSLFWLSVFISGNKCNIWFLPTGFHVRWITSYGQFCTVSLYNFQSCNFFLSPQAMFLIFSIRWGDRYQFTFVISRYLYSVELIRTAYLYTLSCYTEYPYLSGWTQKTGEHGSTQGVVSSKVVKLKILSSSRTLETRWRAMWLLDCGVVGVLTSSWGIALLGSLIEPCGSFMYGCDTMCLAAFRLAIFPPRPKT